MSLLWTRRVLAGGMLAAPFIRAASAQQSLEWVAGSLGGGWYTMAAGLSSLIKDENPDIQIRVVPGGGLANATRVNRNTSPIGWGIDAFAASARRGEEPYKEAHTALRCLGSGYSPTEHHLLRRADAGPEDMKAILTAEGAEDRLPAAVLDRRDDAAADPEIPRHQPGADPRRGRHLPERQLCRYRRGLYRRPGGLPVRRAGPAGGDLHRDRARPPRRQAGGVPRRRAEAPDRHLRLCRGHPAGGDLPGAAIRRRAGDHHGQRHHGA